MPLPAVVAALSFAAARAGALGSAATVSAAPSGSTDTVRLARRGSELYAQTCAICHGASGGGYKADRAPSLGDSGYLATASDEFLRAAIADGRPGTTMSAWGAERGGPLSTADVTALIARIRAWGGGGSPPPASAESSAEGPDDLVRAASGAAVFAARCARCHGANGVGGEAVAIGAPQFLKSAGDSFLLRAIRFGRANTPMPGFASMGDAAIGDLMALFRRWRSSAAVSAAAPPPAPPPPIPLGPVPLNPDGPEPAGFRLFPAVTPADAVKAQLDRKAKMAILDARVPTDYAREHIAGAVSVPFYDPGPYMGDLPRDAWIVCYCACPHAESGTLAQKLRDGGFAKVTVLDEGFNVWKARKYETRSGRAP